MIVTLDLPPDTEALLNYESERLHLPKNETIFHLINTHVSPPPALPSWVVLPQTAETPAQQAQQLQEMFAQWGAEDAARRAMMTAEKIAAEDAMYDEMMFNIENEGLHFHTLDGEADDGGIEDDEEIIINTAQKREGA